LDFGQYDWTDTEELEERLGLLDDGNDSSWSWGD
jgi:hypothetical protein